MGDGGPGRGGVLRGAVPRRQLPAGVSPSPGVGTALCQVACRPGCEESITPAVKVINNRQGLGGNLHSAAAGLPRRAITCRRAGQRLMGSGLQSSGGVPCRGRQVTRYRAPASCARAEGSVSPPRGASVPCVPASCVLTPGSCLEHSDISFICPHGTL